MGIVPLTIEGKTLAVAVSDAAEMRVCYSSGYGTWDKPDSVRVLEEMLGSGNEKAKTLAWVSSPKKYCNRMRPAKKAAYDVEVVNQWDHSNTVAAAAVVAVAVVVAGVHVLYDHSLQTQCCYQIRSTDYN